MSQLRCTYRYIPPLLPPAAVPFLLHLTVTHVTWPPPLKLGSHNGAAPAAGGALATPLTSPSARRHTSVITHAHTRRAGTRTCNPRVQGAAHMHECAHAACTLGGGGIAYT